MQARPVISSKLTPPSISGILRRDRLIDYLNSVVKPLIWITAPGGAGKTTLVADWIATQQPECIWLRLDESDTSPSTFFQHLLLSAQHALPQTALCLESFSQAYAFDPVNYLLRQLRTITAENPEKKIVLVLDDYHNIKQESAIHNILCEVVEKTSSTINFIFISREAPPSEYVSIKSLKKSTIINWDDIKFSIDDTRLLFKSCNNKSLTTKELASIYEQSNGWAAGIRLIVSNIDRYIKNEETASEKKEFDNQLQKDFFYFFANDIMKKMDKESVNFLCRTAFMPFFTAEMASKISGLKNSEVIINWLVSSNLFMELHSSSINVFSYHPIFREYLKNRLKENHGMKEVRKVSQMAASILMNEGAYEESIEIYLSIEEFESAKKIIKNQSENLISQGRIEQLSMWFDSIPEGLLLKDPELLLFYGQSLLISSTEKSCSILLKSIDSFIQNKEYDMALRASGSYLESLAISGKDYDLLEDCLYKMDSLLQEASPGVEDAAESIACTVLFATSFQKLNHPLQERWKDYAERAIENCNDPLTLIKRCNNMMIYYRFSGEDRKTYHLMDILSPISQKIASIPVLKLQTQLIYAFHYGYVSDEGDKAEEICKKSINEGIESGILLYEFWFRYILILTLLRDSKFNEADEQIKKLISQYTLLPPVRRADILTLSGLHALYTSDFHQAIHDLEKASGIYYDAGAIYPAHWSRIILMLAYIETENIDSYEKILYEKCSADWLGSSYLEYQALCVEAWQELKNKKSYPYTLEKALLLAHKKDFIFIPLIGRERFSKLCHSAIERNIVPNYTKKIILEQKIQPEKNNPFLHSWPYELRIYTLRKFKIKTNKNKKTEDINLQQKPLELLKTIIANSGYNVPIDLICDIIWPDSDGDSAYKSLKTTLYRLRKNMGNDSYIINQNNTLSLSKACWVDALAFWNHLGHIDDMNIKQAISLASYYQSPFMTEDINAPWTFMARSRTEKNHKLLLEGIANYFFNKKEFDTAIEYFEQGLNIDITEEDYYIGIMKCYYKKNRTDRLKITYQKYIETCRTLLNKDPSERVTSVFSDMKRSLDSCSGINDQKPELPL